MSRNYELIRGGSQHREHVLPSSNAANRLLRRGTETAPIAPQGSEENEWHRALRALQRHWRLSLAFTIVVSGFVATVVSFMEPVYEAVAKIQVDPPGNELFSLDARSPAGSMAYAKTQAENLKTDRLALTVIRKLRLDQRLGFSQSGETHRQNHSELSDVTVAEYQALKVFRGSLRVHTDPSSWIISLSYAARDPKLAALVANTTVEQFMEYSQRTRQDAIIQSTKWLSSQLEDIRARMDQSNRRLADFQRTTGITPIGKAQSTLDEKMSELNRQVTTAQADRIQLEALLRKADPNQAATLPQFKADAVVQELSKKLAESRADLKQKLIVYGKNHPKTRELQAQISELQAQLKAEQQSIFSNLQTSYAVARRREDLLNSKLKDTGKEAGLINQYELLKNEAQASEALYNSLYTKVKEAGIAAGSKSNNINWIDRAPVLDSPTRPRRVLYCALGFVVGLVGGVVLALVRDHLDSRLRTVEDVQRLTGLPSVTLVPVVSAPGESRRLQMIRNVMLKSQDNHRAALPVFSLERPDSAEADAVRGLYTAIRNPNRSGIAQVVVFVSPSPAEGKTTIAANLSVSLARHCATCIVDADLREPRLANMFGVRADVGLANVLDGSHVLDQTLVAVPGVPNLVLLPGGTAQDKAGELICSDLTIELLQQLRQRFQFVVIDSPPILRYPDVRSLIPLADGVILVGRAGVTTRQALKRALDLLAQSGSAPVLEVVLNAVDINSVEYRDYGGSYKYP